jgi:hypothetical protein
MQIQGESIRRDGRRKCFPDYTALGITVQYTHTHRYTGGVHVWGGVYTFQTRESLYRCNKMHICQSLDSCRADQMVDVFVSCVLRDKEFKHRNLV